MGEISGFLELWEMDVPGVRRRLILAPTPRERERWYALWLLTQGWAARDTAHALERDPHTVGRWLAAFGEGGPAALIFEQSGGSPRETTFRVIIRDLIQIWRSGLSPQLAVAEFC